MELLEPLPPTAVACEADDIGGQRLAISVDPDRGLDDPPLTHRGGSHDLDPAEVGGPATRGVEADLDLGGAFRGATHDAAPTWNFQTRVWGDISDAPTFARTRATSSHTQRTPCARGFSDMAKPASRRTAAIS